MKNNDDRLKKLNKIADGMNNNGLTLSELLEVMTLRNSSILQLSSESFDKFAKLYDQLTSQNFSVHEKGKILEDLINVLFLEGYPLFFEVRRNCRTSSNEIDLQINWSETAETTNLVPRGIEWGESFLCECKNYEGKAGVTYIGKFYSLMCYTKTRLGIFISWNGITGKPNSWNDASGLIKKLALGDDRYIIVISKNDLERIRNKKTNIFTLIKDKYRALKNDIDYSKFIQDNGKHEIETKKIW